MPFYRPLSPTSATHWPMPRPLSPQERQRTAAGLLRLRQQFHDDVPQRTLSDTLLLATWNIREFDAGQKFQPRLPESFYYIAEILSHFDIIAVQEIRDSLAPLDRVMSLLGSWWKYLVTDVTYGRSGNGERMAFVYDSRKVQFAGLAGELVLPPEETSKEKLQWARTPYLCGFKAHWVRFNLCSVHMFYGTKSPTDKRRLAEIQNLTDLLNKYVLGGPAKQPTGAGPDRSSEDLVLIGDFNIFKRTDATMKVLKDGGFIVPPQLTKLPGTSLDKSKCYDQIAFKERRGRFEPTGKAGVFDPLACVFTKDEEDIYKLMMSEKCAKAYGKAATAAKKSTYYRDWSTYQMSDHKILWVELCIDFGGQYLKEASGAAAPPP